MRVGQRIESARRLFRIGLDDSRMVLPGGAYAATGTALNMLWPVAREEWRSTPLGAFEWRAIEFIRRLW
jgi:hypothetical protein